MKRIIIVLLGLCLANVSIAQKVKFGYQNSIVLYGAHTDQKPIQADDPLYQAPASGLMPTYRTGITLQYPVLRNLGLESGILVDLMGYRYSQSKPSSGLAAFKGNVLSFSLKVPLLAYYKFNMKSGGSYFLGGGLNLNYAFSALYKYRLGGVYHSYQAIEDITSNVNQFSTGYQIVLGIEDSEYSQFRLSYGANLNSFTRNGVNDIYPFYLAFTLISRIN